MMAMVATNGNAGYSCSSAHSPSEGSTAADATSVKAALPLRISSSAAFPKIAIHITM
jgi:hypothetical protein